MVLLCIMDGFGLREATPDNAVAAAHKPNYDRLVASCPFTKIDGSGPAVGLPAGQMGNSEVGHLNLGAGRVVYQEITRIDKAIADGDFFDNEVLSVAMKRVAAEGRAVHLFGLVSDGGVHSSLNHLYALVELARRHSVKEVYLHAFMDGRDTPPTSGQHHMAQVVREFGELGLGRVSTVGGRYYGMDRDKRWDRTEKAYRAVVYGEGQSFADPVEAIRASYAKNVTDEFIVPAVIDLGSPQQGRLKNGDLSLFFNFRSDRVRQLCRMLLGYPIDGVNHPDNPKTELVTLTSYDVNMSEARVAFEQAQLKNILGDVLARAGLRQLRTAETEKYAHVTFFFNGGVEEPFEGEDRDLIASPRVATYDLKPEMSSVEVTDNAVAKIRSGKYDFVVLNYANCDMVGHTGVFEAARKAVEAVDTGVGRLMEAVTSQNGVAIITADHGNAETMIDPETGGPWTAHTSNLVPCILYDPSKRLSQGAPQSVRLRDGGVLADIAPTILEILGLEIPREITGRSLLARG
ncbi:MAG TPA: 2,3-bisphosphoglycerate-independent phosphoglycerate mutase [Candidatus Deferrimicrobium sp.]|nr:2,3-bisphosphoglycerate-independent phosphoglycerate mutase [Candidatus Deferrimicrobium sp.]